MHDLATRIKELEALQVRQKEEIKNSFHELAQSISPKNLIRSAVRSVVNTPGLKTTALDTVVSAAAGSLGRKLIVRKSGSLLRKVAGTAAKFVITNFVRNKMPAVKQKVSTVAARNGIGAAKTGLDHR